MPHHPKLPALDQSLRERLQAGKKLRRSVPRSAHAEFQPAPNRPDPLVLLESTSHGRLPELVPLRYGRMLATPYTFLRGSAAAMAADLAGGTPATGIRLQLGGDSHLANFGGFGTPERHFIFDVMDFDETSQGPWEWDVKRLAASCAVAGRVMGLSDRNARTAARAAARSYRRWMHRLARQSALEVWYNRIDVKALIASARTPAEHRHRQRAAQKAKARTPKELFARLTTVVEGRPCFRDQPPLIAHPGPEGLFAGDAAELLASYRSTLLDDRRELFDRYRLVDVARKIVGVGSVGTRCGALLMLAGGGDALILQIKEAGPSVLQPFAGAGQYAHHGQRVVAGQRLMQSASDLFLGWTTDAAGRHFYIRQLRDMKATFLLDHVPAGELIDHAELCARALAHAHAKAGDAALISGYLGSSDRFVRAIGQFAMTYADQTERDHTSLREAVRAGRLPAEVEAA